MEGKGTRRYRHYDNEFKLKVLIDYYKSGTSKNEVARKYDISASQISEWSRCFDQKKLSSTDSSINNLITMAKKKREALEQSASKSAEELLREENERLKKALQYSELRNEALHEVLKIGKEKYGLDLLKKVGAKQ